MASAQQNRLFIAESDLTVRQSLTAIFDMAGYSIRAFANGNSLKEAMAGYAPDCAIVDMELPDMDGLELLEDLLVSRPRLPVVMIGGFVEVSTAVRAIRKGALDVIEKPFRPENLMSVIDKACRKKRQNSAPPQVNQAKPILFDTLTTRQMQVLKQLIEGRQNKNIAFNLGISVRTVEVHRARMMKHLGVKNLTELIKMAIVAGVNKH